MIPRSIATNYSFRYNNNNDDDNNNNNDNNNVVDTNKLAIIDFNVVITTSIYLKR